jgi:hypothetical protein
VNPITDQVYAPFAEGSYTDISPGGITPAPNVIGFKADDPYVFNYTYNIVLALYGNDDFLDLINEDPINN